MRLTFETNARDDYFERRIEGGKFTLAWTQADGAERDLSVTGPNLKRGSPRRCLKSVELLAV